MRMANAIVWAAVLLATQALSAAPLAKEKVSDQAKWVAHLDVEAAVASQLGQMVLDHFAKDDAFQAKINEFVSAAGFDPRTDLKGVTLYGTAFDAAAGVAIVQLNYDRQKLIDLLAANKDHQEAQVGERTMHSWSQKPEDANDDGVRVGCFYDDSTIVIARKQNALEAALAVLDGKAASLAKAKSTLLPQDRKGAFLLAAAEGLPAEGIKTRTLRMFTGGQLVAGQDGNTVFASARLTAASVQKAQQLAQAAQGFLAMAQLAAVQGPEDAPADGAKAALLNLAAKVQVNVAEADNAGVITIEASATIEELAALADKAAKARAERKAAK